VDTHVTRISRRLELTKQQDPRKIEEDLMRIIPRERWTDFSHEVIWHGRKLCVARSPKCADCPLEKLCHAVDRRGRRLRFTRGTPLVSYSPLQKE